MSTVFKINTMPIAVQNEVLKNMILCDLIAYSTCSKKCKQQVKKLKINAKSIGICVDDNVHIEIKIPDVLGLTITVNKKENWDSEEDGLRTVEKVEDIVVHSAQRELTAFYEEGVFAGNYFVPQRYSSKWENDKFDLNDWIQHFLEIFNCSEPDGIAFYTGSEIFDLNSLKKVLRKFKSDEISINENLPENHFKSVLNTFKPINKLYVSNQECRDEEFLRKLCIQNFTFFLSNRFQPNYFSSLDNLLANNSKIIKLVDSNFSNKDLNKFIKLWGTGSNPRLEIFQVKLPFPMKINRTVLLKGIEYQETSLKKSSSPLQMANNYYDYLYRLDVFGRDGRKAEVFFEPLGAMFTLRVLF